VDGGSDVAKFHFPQAVAATRGFVFVADHENNRIRSVAVDSGSQEVQQPFQPFRIQKQALHVKY
jgi:hypothetical protein